MILPSSINTDAIAIKGVGLPIISIGRAAVEAQRATTEQRPHADTPRALWCTVWNVPTASSPAPV
jgi:hypothetical protein